ncbi:MAG: CBS domain-containing protein [Flavobacteriales bacterium]|nr:CBS domain-containing protein [Flavobacteriales bacterium]
MLAKDYISLEIPILKSSDTCAQVLRWMDEYRVLHMPVFKGAEFIGIVSEADILNVEDESQPVQSLENKLMKVAVQGHSTIYEVIKLMDDFKLSLLPVLDDNKRLMGTISYKEVISALVTVFNLNARGAVFVLEMNYVDYALSEISRIVESNDSRVLSTHVSFHPDSNLIDVVVKVNTESLTGILQTLERYDYAVKASFGSSQTDDQLQERYEELMRYLNT